MIQQKKADDKSLYRRAKKAVKNGDETMRPVIEYYEGKREEKSHPIHEKARSRLIELQESYPIKQIANTLDTCPVLLYRLINRRYRYVSDSDAQMVAEGDYSELTAKKENMEELWAKYRKAQKILQDQATDGRLNRGDGLSQVELSKKYGLSRAIISKTITDYYRRPHMEVITKVLNLNE